MNDHGKVIIKKLPTGIPGLDEITGGGLAPVTEIHIPEVDLTAYDQLLQDVCS